MSLLQELVETVSDTGEIFNFGEDGQDPKGQLERFLRIPGVEISRIKGLIEALPDMTDVDRTDAQFLQAIAPLVGIIDFNFDIPILRQREEIKRAVEVYKRKGTLFGIRRQVEVITGFVASVDEMADNVLISNYMNRLSANAGLPNGGNTPNFPGDVASYSLDGSDTRTHHPDVVQVFVTGQAGKPLLKSAVLKLAATLGDYSPIDVLLKVALIDPRIDETAYDRTRLADDALDSIAGDKYAEASLVALRTLTSNVLNEVSNSVLSLSLHQGLRGEHSMDEVIYA